MHTLTPLGHALGAATTIALLGGCSGGSSQIPLALNHSTSAQLSFAKFGADGMNQWSHSVAAPQYRRALTPRHSKGWMKQGDALDPLVYMSDFSNNNVTVFNRNGAVQGQIGGLNEPQGLFVDSDRNLWVANTGAATILEFARGATTPSKTLRDPAGYPVDVTICPNGTVYVSNNINYKTGTGNIQIYPPGSTKPTGTLTYPGQAENYFVTCDAAGNVFTTLLNGSFNGRIAKFPGGKQSGATDLGISLLFPGGIKPNNAGNILVNDQGYHTITEYTEAGAPTGSSIKTGSGDIVDIAVTRNSRIVGGADAFLVVGDSWTFPGGSLRHTYNAPGAQDPIGFSFDPGQKGI